MAAPEAQSALFPIFILSLLALLAVPWTIYIVIQAFGSGKRKKLNCPCSVCAKVPKNQDSIVSEVLKFSTCTNVTLVLMWLLMAILMYYIKLINREIQPFEPFSILGLTPGASDSEIKKAYYKLSRQYHPDKNPDPAANKYFVDFISKAYQALTDEVARKNLEEYGHPDGRQSIALGIALPKFMLDIQGPQGGLMLLALVGVGILLPLVGVVIFLSQSSKYTGNNIMNQTLVNYFHLMKPSLAPSKVMDVLTKAAEFIEMPVRRQEEEPLQKLFVLVRSELNLDPKNLKQETAKFWKRHPALVKVEILLLAQLCRYGDEVPAALKADFMLVLRLLPRLLEELLKMSMIPRTSDPHGWLRPAVGVMELSQCIMQGVPLSARRVTERLAATGTAEGTAGFVQLPHVTETVVKKMGRKKVRSLQELRDLPPPERLDVLTAGGGLSLAEAADVEAVLATMPNVTLEAECLTEGEEGIQEGDVVTLKAWVTMHRANGQIAAMPHTPHFPYPKDEAFWLILADTNLNSTWVSQKVTFLDDQVAAQSAAKLVREALEGEGAEGGQVAAAAAEAAARARSGARLVMSKFLAPQEGSYSLTAFCLSDVWIGCDKKQTIKLKVAKRSRAGTRVPVADESAGLADNDEEEAEEGEEEEEAFEEEYDSEYSDEDEGEEEEEPAQKSRGKDTKPTRMLLKGEANGDSHEDSDEEDEEDD